MGEARRRADLARIRAEIGPEKLARRQARNGKLRAAYGIPGDGGAGDECQVCGRPFENCEITVVGKWDGRPVDAGECCADRLTNVSAIGLYMVGPSIPRARFKRAMGILKELGEPIPFPTTRGNA
jgi:hypothetical protein